MSSTYKKIVLDPRCLKSRNDVNDSNVHADALIAIESALKEPNILPSEKAVLDAIKLEIIKNGKVL